MFNASGWHIGQSHITKKFSAIRFFTDGQGRQHCTPLLDAETGKAALFDSPTLALNSAQRFDQQTVVNT